MLIVIVSGVAVAFLLWVTWVLYQANRKMPELIGDRIEREFSEWEEAQVQDITQGITPISEEYAAEMRKRMHEYERKLGKSGW